MLLLLRAVVIVSAVRSAPVLQPSDVFEQPLPAGQRKIEFHISVPEVAGVVEGSGPGQPDDEGTGKRATYATCDYVHYEVVCRPCFLPKHTAMSNPKILNS